MEFMKKKMTDEERWNIIEDYFQEEMKKYQRFQVLAELQAFCGV